MVHTKIALGIVDDSEPLRETLTKIINEESDLEVMWQAESGKEALQKLEAQRPQILLMDLRMKGMDGIAATSTVSELYPEIKIIAFTYHIEPDNIIKMYSLGVRSFLDKISDIEILLKAIRIVHTEGNYLTNHALQIIRNHLSSNNTLWHLPDILLNVQERALIKHLIDGLSSREIGLRIFRSPRTVEGMREKLYIKLNVGNKEQLIAMAAKWTL